MVNFIWRLVVVIHFVIVGVIVASGLMVPFKEPWWISAPIIMVVLQQFFGDCPLTRLENWFRVKAGKPKIRGFIKHYIKDAIFKQ